ncbi:unnamed protein product [Candida verbasci]|uniref:Uncharacterized protein n=1 Tax=Candida verbasci TaxID=1227364 RepID=A0A9W4U0J6_9ASCO|nr:unnamed protein product [Candida verbasci]
MSEPAPYGGYIVKSLEDEKLNEQKLKDESIEVNVDGETQIIRPESIYIKGVDSLSTDEIKSYIEYYLNYTTKTEEEKIIYEQIPYDQQLTFKVEWIDDSSINIVFKTSEDSKRALKTLTVPDININNVEETIFFQAAKSYKPIIEFRKQQSLSNRLGLNNSENGDTQTSGMDEDDTDIELQIRQSFQSDRKIKNASQYSRYYLIHGEPERKPRNNGRRHYNRDRGGSYRPKSRGTEVDEDEDLFADNLKRKKMDIDDEEEDLFADKLKARERDRSPTRTVNFDSYRQR